MASGGTLGTGLVVRAAHPRQPPDRRLDEHDVAAHRRVVHAGGDADLVLLADLLRVHLRPAEQVIHHLLVHDDRLDLSRGDLPTRPGHAGWPAPTCSPRPRQQRLAGERLRARSGAART